MHKLIFRNLYAEHICKVVNLAQFFLTVSASHIAEIWLIGKLKRVLHINIKTIKPHAQVAYWTQRYMTIGLKLPDHIANYSTTTILIVKCIICVVFQISIISQESSKNH